MQDLLCLLLCGVLCAVDNFEECETSGNSERCGSRYVSCECMVFHLPQYYPGPTTLSRTTDRKADGYLTVLDHDVGEREEEVGKIVAGSTAARGLR